MTDTPIARPSEPEVEAGSGSAAAELRNVRRRVARLLLGYANLEISGWPRLTERGIAEKLDTSSETVHGTLTSLQAEGAITIQRHRIVIHKKALEQIVIETALARTYVLLKTKDGNLEKTIDIVRRQPGVVTADQVEGAADAIFTVQAPDRESLAELTVRAIAAVENMTEDIQLLPIRE